MWKKQLLRAMMQGFSEKKEDLCNKHPHNAIQYCFRVFYNLKFDHLISSSLDARPAPTAKSSYPYAVKKSW